MASSGSGDGLPVRKRLVQRAQFLREDRRRPGVADDVVHGQQQNVIVRCEPQQVRANQRPSCQIEGPLRFGDANPARFALALRLRDRCEILGTSLIVQRGCDHLHRLPIFYREGSALRFMPPHNFVQIALSSAPTCSVPVMRSVRGML